MTEKGPKFNFHAYPEMNGAIARIMEKMGLKRKTDAVAQAVHHLDKQLQKQEFVERRKRQRGGQK